MIPNQWYPIIESRRVRPDRALALRRFGIDLVLWRAAGGQIACLRGVIEYFRPATRLAGVRVP